MVAKSRERNKERNKIGNVRVRITAVERQQCILFVLMSLLTI